MKHYGAELPSESELFSKGLSQQLGALKKIEIFPWSDRFETGIPEIDQQHRQLVNLLNAMVSQMAYGGQTLAAVAILNELKAYAKFHFRSEEAVWKTVFSGDSWEETHEQSHRQFVSDINDLEAGSISSSEQGLLKGITAFLTHWLALHIIEHDARMARVVLAVRSGSSLEDAKVVVSTQMDGPTRAVIDTVMLMYDHLADRTLQLSSEVNRRLIAEQRLVSANEELQAKADIIEDRNVQLNAMFNLSPDGFVAFSRAGRVKFVNPAFHTMTGISREEILGGSEDDLELALRTRCELSKTFAGIKTASLDANGEPVLNTITLRDPRSVVLQMVSVASDSASVSKILYFRDVTKETTVDQMKSEFLSTAAHELRNPMSSIYGFSEVLMTQDLEPDVREEVTGIILSQSEMMVSILNELLDLARIEARQGKDFNLQRLSLQEVLVDVISGYHVPPGRNEPVCTFPSEPLYVKADREKVMQAVINVLANAYKYSPDGGDVEIVVELLCENDAVSLPTMVSINVTDHGIGMSPEQVERVGERFYRADKGGGIPGTGLGMSIVKEVMALHHGQLAIRSQLGAGSTIMLRMPLAQGKLQAIQDDQSISITDPTHFA